MCVALLLSASPSLSQTRKSNPPSANGTPTPTTSVRIGNVHGYPELLVDGHPFFVHAAEFSYFRTPRDLWSQSLDRYHELGINTIDLRIPWNWHEVREGEFDFDGHTNLRRDLRALLRMIAEKGFHLIARPGPVIGNLWRGGGYPDWLLARPEYQISVPERIAGLYPLAERTQAMNAGSAAKQWLGNATHMQFAEKWLAAVAHELAPYSSSKTLALPSEPANDAEPKEKDSPGPLLLIYLDDEAALDGAGSETEEYWRYIETLRSALLAGGIAPGIAPRNGGGFAIVAAHAEHGFAHPESGLNLGIVGEWFMSPGGRTESADPKFRGIRLTDFDAQTLALLAQSLRTQPLFPGLLASYQAGWFAPSNDSDAPPSPPVNTLLSSRWLLAQGAKGIGYAPLQDGISPPGFQMGLANREFRWGAALDLSGAKQARGLAVERNAQMLEVWGDFLAAAHPRVDIGLVDWRAYFSSAGDSSAVFRQVERIAYFSNFPIELVDPLAQSADLLLHDPMLLLVIPEPVRGKKFLPTKAEAALLDYVRQGGTLVCNPERPAGPLFDEALRGATSSAVGEGMRTTRIGNGQIIEWSKDFYSWVDPGESFTASHDRQETIWAVGQLRAVARLAGIHAPIVKARDHAGGLLFSELVWNKASGALGAPAADCAPRPNCAGGMLSVTNWSGEETIQDTLNIISPFTDARMPEEFGDIELPIEIPPRESLLLPLNIPLCAPQASGGNCTDRVVAAGAELLQVAREGKTLELTFYAPSKATILLKLEAAPSLVEVAAHVPETDQDKLQLPERTLNGTYYKETGVFEVVLPRGPAPKFLRGLKIHLPYTPDVVEKKKPPKRHGRGHRYSVADAVRFPLGGGTSLPTEPPLILLDADQSGRLLLDAENRDNSTLSLQATVDGAVHGTESLHFNELEEKFLTLKLKAADANPPGTDGLYHGELSISGDRKGDHKSPLSFLTAAENTPVHYQYDFERSGTNNWVMENKSLRLILLPAAGGQAVALVDKLGGFNLTTTVGGLRDMLRIPGTESRLLDLNFNVPYAAEWLPEKEGGAIRLKARWPEGAPVSGDIVKTVRMNGKDGRDTIEVEYQIHKDSPKVDDPRFVTGFSVPAIADLPENTQFCWSPGVAGQATIPNPAESGNTSAVQCKAYSIYGDPLVIPADASRLEVRTTGRPTFIVEWTKGRITIEQERFSGLILLEFPPTTPGGDSGSVVVRYTILRNL